MPRRLWCGWKVELSGRMIRRPLTDDEHAMLETRADELEIALTPYMRPHQDDIIAEAISDMLGGFQGARATGADALGKIASMMALLEPFPAWAIREACAAMRRNGYEVIDRDGNKRRERHWPPSDAEVYAEVEEVVRLRRAALESARALLSAQVDA